MPELICRLFRVKSTPGVAVVALQGAIDPKNVATLQAALSSAGGQGFHTLVLDLGEIRYINSMGMAYLVNLSDAMIVRGGGLFLANTQPKVKVVFELMGLTELFKLYRSVESALAAVGGGRRTQPVERRAPSRSRRS